MMAKLHGAAAKKVQEAAIKNAERAAWNIAHNNFVGATWDLQDALQRIKRLQAVR